MPRYVGAIDQGTTSTRFLVFDHDGRVVTSDQREHGQITPQPGWVEHDPWEIWQATRATMATALERAGIAPRELAAIGITNQRETTVLWDRETGEPLANAIVWQDTRTAGLVRDLAGDAGRDRLRDHVGLPVDLLLRAEARLAARTRAWRAEQQGGDAFGTIDNWLLWNLDGGAPARRTVVRRRAARPGQRRAGSGAPGGGGTGGVHATDVSRTLLLDLHTLDGTRPGRLA